MRRVRAFSISAREFVRNRGVDDWEQHLAEVCLGRLIQQPSTDLVPLDAPDATSTGCLLAVTGPATSSLLRMSSSAREGPPRLWSPAIRMISAGSIASCRSSWSDAWRRFEPAGRLRSAVRSGTRRCHFTTIPLSARHASRSERCSLRAQRCRCTGRQFCATPPEAWRSAAWRWPPSSSPPVVPFPQVCRSRRIEPCRLAIPASIRTPSRSR
jgi:hypothetical protein